MMKAHPRGFTLIELLVVISIIVILGGVLLPSLHLARQRAQVQKCEAEIVSLKTALEQYRTDFGDYPPSTLSRLGGPASAGAINEGNEAMTACLTTRRINGPYFYPSGPTDRRFKNLDGPDPGDAKWTDWVLPGNELREIVDPWDNPYIYFHGRDLREGTTATCRIRGDDVPIEHAARGNDGFGTTIYYSAMSFQLWSVGPDGSNEYGAGDDVASWSVKERP